MGGNGPGRIRVGELENNVRKTPKKVLGKNKRRLGLHLATSPWLRFWVKKKGKSHFEKIYIYFFTLRF